MNFSSGARPLYLQLADHLRKQMEDGLIRAGEKLASETELAEKFNLARGTVRQALDVLMAEGLLERVQGKGTFIRQPEVAEKALSGGGGRKLVGVIVPYLRDALVMGMLRGIERTLRAQGYSLIYGSSDGTYSEEREQIRRLQENEIAGLVLMPISTSNEALMVSQTLAAGLPLVVIDRRIPGYEANLVQVDNFMGGRLAVQHLLECGHRRIACISHQGSTLR